MVKKLILVAVAMSVMCCAAPALDATAEFNNALHGALQKRGLTDKDLLAIVNDKRVIDEVADLLVDVKTKSLAERELQKLIAAGKYDQVMGDITAKHFPLENDDVVDLGKLEVVTLSGELSTFQVVKELDELGFRPAKLRGLLAYGAKYPDEQRKYEIWALGSVIVSSGGNRLTPCLHGDSGRRELTLYMDGPDGLWFDDGRFLAVRK